MHEDYYGTKCLPQGAGEKTAPEQDKSDLDTFSDLCNFYDGPIPRHLVRPNTQNPYRSIVRSARQSCRDAIKHYRGGRRIGTKDQWRQAFFNLLWSHYRTVLAGYYTHERENKK